MAKKIVHAAPQRPLFLLVDGHKSHIAIDAIAFCRENEIILFCLPPHTTHALQPLDVAVFKSLKNTYSKTVKALCGKKPNLVVTKGEFAKIIKCPIEKSFSVPNVKSGFRKCGIYPFDPSAILSEKMTPSSLYTSSSSSPSSSSTTSILWRLHLLHLISPLRVLDQLLALAAVHRFHPHSLLHQILLRQDLLFFLWRTHLLLLDLSTCRYSYQPSTRCS